MSIARQPRQPAPDGAGTHAVSFSKRQRLSQGASTAETQKRRTVRQLASTRATAGSANAKSSSSDYVSSSLPSLDSEDDTVSERSSMHLTQNEAESEVSQRDQGLGPANPAFPHNLACGNHHLKLTDVHLALNNMEMVSNSANDGGNDGFDVNMWLKGTDDQWTPLARVRESVISLSIHGEVVSTYVTHLRLALEDIDAAAHCDDA